MSGADDNDRAIDGSLPADPAKGTKQVAEAPRLRTAHDLLAGAMSRAFSREPVRSCPTGHHELDEMTGGILPGWCWVVAAVTNWGKSTFATALADGNLRAGRLPLIVSLEDAEELYADRLLLRRARRDAYRKINADRLRLHRLLPEELQLVTEVVNEAERKPMFIDARGRKGEWIAQNLEHTLDNVPVDLVILDYLGEVRSGKRQQDRRNEVSEMAALLRGAVKSRNRSLVILSQITIDDDADKFPRMHQVRDSRDVINAAEVVAMCGIPKSDVTGKDGRVKARAGERAMLLEKVKQGRKGMVQLHWDDEAACFVDVEDPHASPEPPEPPLGRSWSPAERADARPPPPHWQDAAERDGEDLGGFAQDGFGGI